MNKKILAASLTSILAIGLPLTTLAAPPHSGNIPGNSDKTYVVHSAEALKGIPNQKNIRFVTKNQQEVAEAEIDELGGGVVVVIESEDEILSIIALLTSDSTLSSETLEAYIQAAVTAFPDSAAAITAAAISNTAGGNASYIIQGALKAAPDKTSTIISAALNASVSSLGLEIVSNAAAQALNNIYTSESTDPSVKQNIWNMPYETTITNGNVSYQVSIKQNSVTNPDSSQNAFNPWTASVSASLNTTNEGLETELTEDGEIALVDPETGEVVEIVDETGQSVSPN